MDIVFEPYEKITIRSYMKHENAQAFVAILTSMLQKGVGPKVGTLYWANGVLFRYTGFSPTDRVNNEYLNRHLPLDLLEFTSMPQFKKEIRSGEFVITVLDVSNHDMHNKLTRWIAENLMSDNSHVSKTTNRLDLTSYQCKSSVIGNVVILSSKSRVPVFINTDIIQDTPLSQSIL